MPALAIVAFDDFDDLELFLSWDLLNRPVRFFPEQVKPWEVLLLGEAESHRSASGLEIAMQGTIDEARFADAVLIAGGRLAGQKAYDFEYLGRLSLDSGKQIVGALGAGSTILGGLGLLHGLAVASNLATEKALQGFGSVPSGAGYHQSENLATALGLESSVELCRWMIARLSDEDIADQALKGLLPS